MDRSPDTDGGEESLSPEEQRFRESYDNALDAICHGRFLEARQIIRGIAKPYVRKILHQQITIIVRIRECLRADQLTEAFELTNDLIDEHFRSMLQSRLRALDAQSEITDKHDDTGNESENNREENVEGVPAQETPDAIPEAPMIDGMSPERLQLVYGLIVEKLGVKLPLVSTAAITELLILAEKHWVVGGQGKKFRLLPAPGELLTFAKVFEAGIGAELSVQEIAGAIGLSEDTVCGSVRYLHDTSLRSTQYTIRRHKKQCALLHRTAQMPAPMSGSPQTDAAHAPGHTPSSPR